AQRNVELMWLTGRLMPDFKTIANFRKDNAKGIRGVCLRIPRHPATQSTNIRPPIPRSSGQAVGAQRRRFAL
ncbi:hypothetical protein, partial [Pseudomonas syringae]|uniref:hypothetical protein n=1 Tax=Pseudomonas syringae TaxID=317 RepID=UPI00244670CB